jgi:16S rRNA (uracil1498-N3)-methyltransferase
MPVVRVLVPSMTAADRVVSLPPADAHHLGRVLRANIGDEIRVFDGRGREWMGRLAGLDRASAVVEIVTEIAPVAEPPVRVTLAIGLLKGDQMDTVVRDATMLGAASIVPMLTTHVAVPERALRSGAAIIRWRRVAAASARQCGRAVVAEVGAVTPFAAVLHLAAGAATFMCVEPRLTVRALRAGDSAQPQPGSALVLVGPEGGWSEEELDQARAAGVTFVHLGPRTLRAEAVPAVVLSALWTCWGW